MSLKTWQKRVGQFNAGEPISNSLINALKFIFNRSMMSGAREEQGMLEEHVLYQYGEGPGWKITPEQTQKGLDWLKRSNVWRHLEGNCQNIVNEFERFTFEGVRLEWVGLRQSAELVYRVYGKSGSYFDYTASPWQQGSREPFDILDVSVRRGEN